MPKATELKTKRLRLCPLSDAALRDALYEAQTAEETRRYSELYAMVRLYPTHRLWCTLWELRRKADDRAVGCFWFDGPADERGEAVLHCRIYAPYRGMGYGGEALEEVLRWAWKDERAYFLRFSLHDPAFRETLEKLGFVCVGGVWLTERPLKPKTKDMMSLGVSLGLLIGVFPLGDLTAGILIGALAGLIIGGYFDAKDRRIRENLRQKRQ